MNQEGHDRLIRLDTQVQGHITSIDASLERIEGHIADSVRTSNEIHESLRTGINKADRKADSARIWSKLGPSLWGMTIVGLLAYVGIRREL